VIKHTLEEATGILILEPQGRLSTADFAELTRLVDQYLYGHDRLNGLMIEAASFPGWEDFTALVSHLRFVRDHHRKIRRIAVVTDSKVLTLGPKLAAHFVSAEVRTFPASERDAAMAWLAQVDASQTD
jgi:hypothetical protein